MSSSDPYQLALFVAQKISCSFSIIGSLMISSQVIRNKRNRSKPQQRITLGFSILDLMLSTAWLLSNFLMPPWSTTMLYAAGNQATCDMQGFIVQFCLLGSVLYQVSLQSQYLLTINFNWGDHSIRKIEPILHCIPIVAGLSTAIVALLLNLYNPSGWNCWIGYYPPDCTPTYMLEGSSLDETDCLRGDNASMFRMGFFYGPLWCCIAICLTILYFLSRSVQHTEAKSMRWKRKSQMELKYTREMKLQALTYAGAFFVQYLFPSIVRIIELAGGKAHPSLIVLAGFFAGGQGFYNSFAYFRPRYKKCNEKGPLKKIWFIMRTSLFFCCDGKDTTNDKDDLIEKDENLEGNANAKVGYNEQIGCDPNCETHEEARGTASFKEEEEQ